MKHLIFHQNSRYSLVKKIIERNRHQEHYSILEVGSGAHHNLADFLTNDNITFLDIALPEEVLTDPRFMIGDATDLPFDDASYDFIIGLDVLEHIPTEKRTAFFREAMRVSREGIILTFPHAHITEDVDDSNLREFYKLMTNNYPVWVDEHIDCSLPSWQYAVEEIRRIDSTVSVHHLFQSNRMLMYCLLRWEALASAYPETGGLFGSINDQYCCEYLLDDFCETAEDACKTCIVIDKCGRLEIASPRSNGSRIEQFRLFAEELFESTLNLINLSRSANIDTKLKGLFDVFQGRLNLLENQLNEKTAWMTEEQRGLLHIYNEQLSNRLTDIAAEEKATISAFGSQAEAKLEEKAVAITETQRDLLHIYNEQLSRKMDSSTELMITQLRAQISELQMYLDAQRSVLTKLKHYMIPADVENEWQALDSLRAPEAVSGEKASSSGKETEKRDWPVMMDVLLICYNQSRYIEQTLETILAQKTEGFRYRVVVADDASKDDTVEKIQKMAEGSGVEFLILPHDQNHGIMQNYKRAFAACTSKYIAVMEGDDLWTDTTRLQKHYNFLEVHTECAMSFNCYEVRNFDTGEHNVQPVLEGGLPYKVFSGGDIAYDNLIGNFSTCVYRKEIIDQLPEDMYSWKGFDWITNLMISRFGGIGCLQDVMNIYRIHSNGVWSGQDQKKKLKDLIEIIDDYDAKLGYVYHDGFAAHKNRLKKMLMPQYVHKMKHGVHKMFGFLKKASRYCPPVFIQILKLLVPEAIKERMRGLG